MYFIKSWQAAVSYTHLDLKQPVIQHHPVCRQGLHSAYGDGVAHHSVKEIVLQHLVVALDPQVVGGDGGEGGDARHHIGQMAEGVFQILGGVVGYLGEGAESGHIDEGAAVEPADIPGAGNRCV